MTQDQYQALVDILGPEKSAIEYSKTVPFDQTFWDKVSFAEWETIFYSGTKDSKGQILQRMIKLADSFEEWKQIHECAILETDKIRALAGAHTHAQTISEWRWVLINSQKGSEIEQTAINHFIEMDPGFREWHSIVYSGKIPLDVCAANLSKKVKNVGEVKSLVLTSIDYFNHDAIKRAEQKLEALIESFADWQKFYESVGRQELKNIAVRNMLSHAVTFEECFFVLKNSYHSLLTNYHRAVIGKMLKLDLSFEQADKLRKAHERKDALAPVCLAKMATKAATIQEWKLIYNSAEGSIKDQALESIIKLSMPA